MYDFEYPVDQAQEHADFIAGSASEFQNCFEESQIHRFHQAAIQSEIVRAHLDAGLFVVVDEQPVYCKVTDACTGTIRYFRSSHNTREDAERSIARRLVSPCDEGQLFVLPALPVAPVVCADADDVPF